MKGIMHPNIIRLYQVIDTTQDVYLVLEHASGGDLYDLISKQGTLEEERAKRLFY